jgi:hypothetical protein
LSNNLVFHRSPLFDASVHFGDRGASNRQTINALDVSPLFPDRRVSNRKRRGCFVVRLSAKFAES